MAQVLFFDFFFEKDSHLNAAGDPIHKTECSVWLQQSQNAAVDVTVHAIKERWLRIINNETEAK